MPTKSIEIIVTDGALPPFWPRSAVFFANLLALFFGNESETQALRTEIGEIDSYGGRLIPIVNLLFRGGENMLVLEHEPDAALCRYFRDDLGLTLPVLSDMNHDRYVSVGRRLLKGDDAGADRMLVAPAEHSAQWIDGFVTDDILARIAEHVGKRTISTCEGSRRGNNKLLLHEFIVSHGLPHVDTVLASSPRDVPSAMRELSRRGYVDAVLKSQVGASGIGLLKLENIADTSAQRDIPEHLFFEGPCMVQGWLSPGVLGVTRMRSPSVQLFLDEDSVYLYDMTEQILSEESVHQGNISPPPYLEAFPGLREEILRQAGEVGRWLHMQGYRGTASADLLLVERAGRDMPDVYVCEINARVTGATYPAMLARHFTPEGSWLLRNVRLSEPTAGDKLLDLFREPHHLFHPGRHVGVLPINFNFGPDGLIHKGQFLCLAQSPERCHTLLDIVREDLGVDWQYERD